MIGCTICTLTMQLSSLVGQCQLVVLEACITAGLEILFFFKSALEAPDKQLMGALSHLGVPILYEKIYIYIFLFTFIFVYFNMVMTSKTCTFGLKITF